MPRNDRILLDQLLDSRRAIVAANYSEAEFFTIFAVEQILKNYSLSDDIDAGITDGGDDGGVDAIYSFIDGVIVKADSDFSRVKRGDVLELVIFQAKKNS